MVCGAAILLLVGLASLVSILQHQHRQPLGQIRSVTRAAEWNSGRRWTLSVHRRKASVALPNVNRRRLVTAAAVQRSRRDRLPGNWAGGNGNVQEPLSARNAEHKLRVSSALPSAAPVSQAVRGVHACVLAIITGSHSNALLSFGGKTRIVSLGDLIDGVRVTGIRENEILLSDHQTLTLPDSQK